MNILQIKIDLKDSKPNITRTVLVADNMTFADLHNLIQSAMGWYDSHLHQFSIGDNLWNGGIAISTKPELDFFDDPFDSSLDGSEIKLSEYLKEGTKLSYEYDFGDGWQHKLSVQKVLTPDPKIKYPTCIKGKNACPPEDCGGIWGYYGLLEAINNPKHEDYGDMREWLGLEKGETFDPTYFDLEETNDEIAGMFE